MAETKTIATLERARNNFAEIKSELEEKTGDSLDNVEVEEYGDIIRSLPTGETTDYSGLDNKPQINGVELIGNKSLADLGITPKVNNETLFFQ